MLLDPMTAEAVTQPVNLTIIIVTALNGLFALLSGIFHVKNAQGAATVRDGVLYVQQSLRPAAPDHLEDTLRERRSPPV